MIVGKTAIEVENLSKAYRIEHSGKPLMALDNVSFSVDKGDVIGVIGNNGSGKSTLLKVLGQVTKPSNGEVRFYGSVTSILDIGTNFHPEFTGRENVQLHLRLKGLHKKEFASIEKKIENFSEIGDFFEHPVKYYSSGMFLRLAFSLAFYLTSDILLLDEVLSVGDEGFRLKCQDMLRQITQQGRTILFVSHNRVEILELSNKCLWLEKGKIRRTGNAATILSEYFAQHRDNYDSSKHIIETKQTATENESVLLKWNEEDAPGNEIMSIRELSINSLNNSPKLYNTEPILIRFVINKKMVGVQIGAFFFIQDIFYQPVLVAHFLNNQKGIDLSQTLKDAVGLIEISCVLPAHFLIPGKYYLLPRFGIEKDQWSQKSEEAFRFSEDLHFSIHTSGNFVDLIGDASKGSVQPLLEWRIKKQGESSN